MNTCKAAIRILKARKLYVIMDVLIEPRYPSAGKSCEAPQPPEHRRMSRNQPASQ